MAREAKAGRATAPERLWGDGYCRHDKVELPGGALTIDVYEEGGYAALKPALQGRTSDRARADGRTGRIHPPLDLRQAP